MPRGLANFYYLPKAAADWAKYGKSAWLKAGSIFLAIVSFLIFIFHRLAS